MAITDLGTVEGRRPRKWRACAGQLADGTYFVGAEASRGPTLEAAMRGHEAYLRAEERRARTPGAAPR